MQTDSTGGNGGTPLRLQDYDSMHEFPAHILQILSPGKPIQCIEILCRLLHVCMIEAGFIPVIGEDPEFEVETLCAMTMNESITKLVLSLQQIIHKSGNLRNVNYTAIVLENAGLETLNVEDSSNESPSLLEITEPTEYNEVKGNSIPVTSKNSDSGDGSTLESMNTENVEQGKDQISPTIAQKAEVKKVYSERIAVSLISEGQSIYVVANGSNFHQNSQISLAQYIRPKNNEQFPMSVNIEDYYRLINFSAIRFVDDMKRGFCYPIMDNLDALSFDIRSLSWFPEEIIVEIAKRCSPVAMIRLRATCSEIRNALSETNQQFWKMMLRRDFPLYNTDNLNTSSSSPDSYYRKYSEMWNFTLRRPLRRIGQATRIFPYYLLSNFRL